MLYIMMYDIDKKTIEDAANKSYGPGTQVGAIMWLDTLTESIRIAITPPRARSFNASFYYKKGSFDACDPDKPIS